MVWPLPLRLPLGSSQKQQMQMGMLKLFYVNGVKYGNPIRRLPSGSTKKFPFGINWSPQSPGRYVIFAECWDNSGNYAYTYPIKITSTSGVNPPDVSITPASQSSQGLCKHNTGFRK